MANPWDADPIVAPAPTAQAAGAMPWESDPIVDEGPGLDIDIVGGVRESQVQNANDSDFARMVSGQPAPEGGFLRDVGMGARSVIQGAGGLFGALGGDAANYYLVPGEQPTYREAAAGLADRLGLPSPQTSRERVMGDVGEALTGTGLTMGAGGAVAGLAPRVSQFLTAQPGLQAVSTATGAGAAGVTRETGGGTGAQIAAGLAGGLTPAAVSAGLPAAVRGAIRGGEAGRQRVAENIQAFRQAGTSPSVGQATESGFQRGVEQTLSRTPGAAGVMLGRARAQAEEIGRGVEDVAQGLSRGSSAGKAGTSVQRGVKEFADKAKAKSTELYDKVDEFIPPDTRIELSDTKAALGSLNATIPGAPNVSRFFQNSKIQGIEGAIDRDLSIPAEAQKALDDALSQIDSLYASRNAAVSDMGRMRAFANDQANRADNFYPVEGAPRFPGRYSQFPERAAEGMEGAGEAGIAAMRSVSRAQQIEGTLEQLQAAADATNGRLPYEAIKKLRTMVGQELDDAGPFSDFPRSKFKALYGALSRDLDRATKAAGPEAQRAAKRANNYYRALSDRNELLESAIEKNGGPEKVFSALWSGAKDGNTTLKAVMQSLPKEGQRDLTAAFVRRLGRATPSAQNAEGDVFSPGTFLTRWDQISPEAKRTLFDRHGPMFSANMDKIARVASNLREGSSTFANPSGTAAAGAQIAGLTSFVTSLATGNVGLAAGIGGGAATANLWARAMTNPRFVAWLAEQTKKPVGALPAQMNVLRGIAERKKEPELAEIADLIEQSYQAQQQEPQTQ